MKVLVVKLTSMGDVLHLMPALSDLQSHMPDVSVDWMVEESFAELPHWHASVGRVIPVATRRWRKFSRSVVSEILSFRRNLRSVHYDLVIDAQGLIKSAVFSRFAKLKPNGIRIGFSGDSIKESPAAYLYQRKVRVARAQHAVDRLRQLLAKGIGYDLAQCEFNYSIDNAPFTQLSAGTTVDSTADSTDRPSIFLLHATTWPSKHVPDQLWRDLASLALAQGYQVKLCWASDAEKQRADWIAENHSHITVLPKSSLNDVAKQLRLAVGAVAVDTGLGHMAAAFGVPCVSLYGSTNAGLTGTVGENQAHLQMPYHCSPCLLKNCDKLTAEVSSAEDLFPPCYQQISAAQIWQRLLKAI